MNLNPINAETGTGCILLTIFWWVIIGTILRLLGV